MAESSQEEIFTRKRVLKNTDGFLGRRKLWLYG